MFCNWSEGNVFACHLQSVINRHVLILLNTLNMFLPTIEGNREGSRSLFENQQKGNHSSTRLMSLIHGVVFLKLAFSVLVLTDTSDVSYVVEKDCFKVSYTVEKTVLMSVMQWKWLFSCLCSGNVLMSVQWKQLFWCQLYSRNSCFDVSYAVEAKHLWFCYQSAVVCSLGVP